MASRLRDGFGPFSEVRRLQNSMDRLFGQRPLAAAAGFPAVNLWTGADSVAITAELPGVDPADVELSVKDDVLTLRGSRRASTDDTEAAWHRRERSCGQFQRLVQLPFRVDPERVEARFADGVLEVDLKRPEADKPRRIEIRH
ncbi:MAG: Hsp20/alpha crystallin family protein [Gammaproteobacteria bacterium]|nr:Hsp20/alpha crystallin family protein [Gammaproteobacteria bacterium]